MEAQQPISPEALGVLTAFIRAMARREALMLVDGLDTHDIRIKWLQDISPEYAGVLGEHSICAFAETPGGDLVLITDDADQPLHVWTANELAQYAEDATDDGELGAIGEALAGRRVGDIEDFYYGEGVYVGGAEINTCVGCGHKNETDWSEC